MLKQIAEFFGNFFALAGVRIITSALMLIFFWKLINIFISRLRSKKFFDHSDESAKSFLLSFLSITMKVILVLTVAANLGIPMTNVVTIIGSCGVAIGLSLQGSLSNFAGGLMILFFRPFGVGDYIEAQNKYGKVVSIAILYTTLITDDNKTIVIPNGSLSNAVVTNYSVQNKRMVELKLTSQFDSDVDKIKESLANAAASIPGVHTLPAPFVALTDQTTSLLTFSLRVWTDTDNYWNVYYALEEASKKVLEELKH